MGNKVTSVYKYLIDIMSGIARCRSSPRLKTIARLNLKWCFVDDLPNDLELLKDFMELQVSFEQK